MKNKKLSCVIFLLLLVITLIVSLTVSSSAATTTPAIQKAGLVINDNIDIMFYTNLSVTDAAKSTTYMTFNDGAQVHKYTTRTIGSVTYVVYTYEDILPQNMGESVSAKLYVGGALKDTKQYSAKDYCVNQLKNTSATTKTKQLVSDLLRYGAAAQKYVTPSISSSNLVTAGVTGLSAEKTFTSMNVPSDATFSITDSVEGEAVTGFSTGLILTDSVSMYFDFTLASGKNISDYAMRIRLNGRSEEFTTFTVKEGKYRVVFSDIMATEFFDSVTATVYEYKSGEFGTRASETVTYSVAQYLKSSYKDDASSLSDLLKQLYLYGQSAHLYVENHKIVFPGTVKNKASATSSKDGYAKTDYTCEICGNVIATLPTVSYRDYTVYDTKSYAGKDFLNVSVSGGYLSQIRNTTAQSGSIGYYIDSGTINSSASSSLYKTVGANQNVFNATGFVLDFKMKAPENGLLGTGISIMNTSGTWAAGNRGITIFSTSTDGAISSASTTIGAAGTVNPADWTRITIVMDFAVVNGEKSIYLEYYVNNSYVTAILVSNTLADSVINQINFTMPIKATDEAGKGILYDDISFSYGAVHSFTNSIAEHLAEETVKSADIVREKIISDFVLDDFSEVVMYNSSTKTLSTKTVTTVNDMTDTIRTFSIPETTPKAGQHPRLLFTSDDIPGIVTAMQSEENKSGVSRFLTRVSASTTGILADPSEHADGLYNYDSTMLEIIEAKAFYYAIYKNDAVNKAAALAHGYEAIYAIKNYILTFNVCWKATDQCRLYGHVMYVTALVYDWCYDLLTQNDKDQLLLGVQNKLCDGYSNEPALSTHNGIKFEVGYPPQNTSRETPITGHGAEFQVLRDYFAFSIAIYDEMPTWYNYIGGMIYTDYVPVREYYYKASYYPDGTACYNYYRYLADLWNAWLIVGMDGDLPYTPENMQSVIYGLMSNETYDGAGFGSGDGGGLSVKSMGSCALVSSFLFDDGVARAQAKYCLSNFTSFSGSQSGITSVNYLILSSKGTKTASNRLANLKTITYSAGFAQQIVARNSTDSNAAVVLMQGAQKMAGGHTHQSAGNFQIYYKGFLTIDDGVYDTYGSTHHYYYHMSTVAHNGILVYNPAHASTSDSTYTVNGVNWYSGGQRARPYGPDYYFTNWLKDSASEQGYLTGVKYGYYNSNENTPEYIYFANNFTNAYPSDTVSDISRSFITLYTNNTKVPMVMFVYDDITSVNASFQKTFLLQCVKEPTISGNTVTINNGTGGKLVLTSLQGADSISKYGGTTGDAAQRFWISGQGKNLPAAGGLSSGGKSNKDAVWGHVEIQPTIGNKNNKMLNVLYVTDSTNTTTYATTKLSGADYIGGAFLQQIAIFIDENKGDETFTVDTSSLASGTYTYYIGGLKDGTWYVKIGNGAETTYTISESEHFLTFTGAKGTVTFRPGEDVRPSNAGKITYELNEGTLAKDAPIYYDLDTPIALPTPTRNSYLFDGWFTDATFTNKITTTENATMDGLTVYAKWLYAPVNADYTGGSKSDAFSYSTTGNDGVTASYTIPANADYLLWTSTGKSPQILKTGSYTAWYGTDISALSLEITVGRDGTNALLPIFNYIRSKDSTQTDIKIFNMNSSGKVYLGNNTVLHSIGTVPDSGTMTIRIVIDFAKEKLIAFDEAGNELDSIKIPVSVPSGYSSYLDWFHHFNNTSNYAYCLGCSAAGSIRISSFNVTAGYKFAACRNLPLNNASHTWDKGTVTKAASTTDCTPGTKVYTCQNCGAQKKEIVASAVSHTLAQTSVINDEAKEFTLTCSVCQMKFAIKNTVKSYNYEDGSGIGGTYSPGDVFKTTLEKSGANHYVYCRQAAVDTNQSAYMYQAAYGNVKQMTSIVLSFDLSAPEAGLPSASDANLLVKDINGSWPGAAIYISSNGSLKDANKTVIAPADTVTYGKWTNVIISINTQTGYTAYWIDGVLVKEIVFTGYRKELQYMQFGLPSPNLVTSETYLNQGILVDNTVLGTSINFVNP